MNVEAATNFDAKLQRRRKQITTGWKNPSATKLNSPTSTMSEPAWKGFLHCIVLHIFPKHVQTLLHYTSSFAGCMRFLYCCLVKTCNWRLEVLVAHNDQKQTSKLQAIWVLPLIMLHPWLEVKELILLLVWETHWYRPLLPQSSLWPFYAVFLWWAWGWSWPCS